jgi:YHS domain-containing protein
MKNKIMNLTVLAILAGTIAIANADNSSALVTTNNPTTGTNAPVKPYPFNYCLNSGEKLGEMGKPVVIDYKGQEFKFCCADCAAEFKKSPDKFVKKLAEAKKKQKSQ